MIEQTIEEFIDYLKNVKEASENTILSYSQDLEKFRIYITEHKITAFDQVTETFLTSYVLFLEKNLKSATVARNLVTIKAFFLYLIKKHLIEEDPTERIKPPKVIKKPPVNLTIAQVETLLNAPQEGNWIGMRDKAMFEVLYATGIKSTELIQLTIHDINMQYNILTCVGAKKNRVIPFGENAKTALEKYLFSSREELMGEKEHEYLFVNRSGDPLTRQGFWKIIKKYAMENGIENVTPQSLRNSFAAHLIANGANVTSVGDMLGYSNSSMAYIYADNNEARIRDEYMKAHPRA
ncbi:MAG: tyrosine-type recombinase/integrase [bacterium]|nr:tyrosine-type recombinase/integrase [bacterium]